jgi:ubiquinone/menaquinone biosynthesis C-methylase UbiE
MTSVLSQSATGGNVCFNRFNVIFENAGAVVYHKDDIIDFLSKLSSMNMLQKSVLSDIKDENIYQEIVALAIIGKIIMEMTEILVYLRGPLFLIFRQITPVSIKLFKKESSQFSELVEKVFVDNMLIGH